METVDISSLPVHTNDWLLDLGCGEGRHSIAANFYFPNAHIIGLDLDLNSLNTANEKLSTFGDDSKNTFFVKGSGIHLPFHDASFDHVICSEVLEHIKQYELFLSEIKRILKPGGTFCFSIPRAWPEKICWSLCRQYYQVEGGHVRIFNDKSLAQEVENLNFQLARKHWAHALHSPYWWLRCAWWRNGRENPLSGLYHKILVWDLLKRPWLTRKLEQYLNPLLGKSVVYYFRKQH